MLLRLHLTLESIQALCQFLDVALARASLQGLATESACRAGALAVGTCLMLVQGVATDFLAAAFITCTADFASLVPVVVGGGMLTWRWTWVVLGREVGVHGVLRRRCGGQWGWLRMLLLLLGMVVLLQVLMMWLRRVLM
jgi:hypothetical protein